MRLDKPNARGWNQVWLQVRDRVGFPLWDQARNQVRDQAAYRTRSKP
jgi:hypothetical protein